MGLWDVYIILTKYRIHTHQVYSVNDDIVIYINDYFRFIRIYNNRPTVKGVIWFDMIFFSLDKIFFHMI